MAGSITVSSITLDSDNNFSIKSNTGATLFFANTSGVDIANSIGATAITNDKILSVANTKISGNIISSQITSNPTLYGNVSVTGVIGVGGATPSTSGSGITFPATQSASSDANTLDDYEEGSWTPTLPNGGTLTNIGSFYTKIGRTVYVQLHLNNIAPTNNGSEFQIGSLPFSSTSTSGSFGGGCFQYCGNTNLSNFLPIITNNGNYFFFHQNSGTIVTITNSTYVGLAGATKSMIINAWYITN